MNRFKRAWLAFNDKLPPRIETRVVAAPPIIRERILIGDPTVVNLYQARTATYAKPPPEWDNKIFLSSEQAFNVCGTGAVVRQFTAIKIEGEYFVAPEMKALKVEA